MKSKKLQQVFFSSLVVVSILSSLYLNLHVEHNQTHVAELAGSETESSVRLMADIEAFQHIIQNVVNQLTF